MLNAEKFKKEIESFDYMFAVVENKVVNCADLDTCENCEFKARCGGGKIKWLLEECEESILTDEEKAYLKSVIELRRDEITIITKNRYCANTESEFTTIEVYVKNPWVDINKNDRTCPNYKLLDLITTEDMPFNGMKLFEHYTLEDLGL